jgi:hypothetical protein
MRIDDFTSTTFKTLQTASNAPLIGVPKTGMASAMKNKTPVSTMEFCNAGSGAFGSSLEMLGS